MKELLYKQLRLVAHPMTLVFTLSGAMLLIPNYPYTVAFFYVTLGLFFMFQNAREQRDSDYSALLPIRKRDTVKCAALFTFVLEIVSVIVAALFAYLVSRIASGRDNLAGLDANPALLGMGLLLFAVFNRIFLPSFYRTGYKLGVSFLKACAGALLIVVLDVILPHIVPWLDGIDARQYIVLGASVIVYALTSLIAYRRAAALYERVDL